MRMILVYIHTWSINLLALKRSYLYKREMWWNCTNRFGSFFFFALRARKWRELFNLVIFKEVEWILCYLFWNSCHYHIDAVSYTESIGSFNWLKWASINVAKSSMHIHSLNSIYVHVLMVSSKWCTWSVIIVTHFECYANVLSPNAGFFDSFW